MKNVFLLLILFTSLFVWGQNSNNVLKILPEKPEVGKKIEIIYTIDPLSTPKNLYCFLYQNFKPNDTRVVVLPLSNSKKKYSVEYELPNNLKSFLIIIKDSLDVYDNNNSEGFWFPVYLNGKYSPDALALIADMYAGWRNNVFKIDKKYDLALKLYNEEFSINPSLKNKHFLYYLFTLEKLPNNKYLFEEVLKDYSESDSLSGNDYQQIAEIYRRLNNMSKYEYFKKLQVEKFSQDRNVINHTSSLLFKNFYENKIFTQKTKLFNQLIDEYSYVNTKDGISSVNHMKGKMLAQLLKYYLLEEKYSVWEQKVKEIDQESQQNAFWLGADDLLNKDTYSEKAEMVAQKASELGMRLLTRERDWREPLDLTDEEVKKYREKYYVHILSTYGKCLEKNGKLELAKETFKKASIVYGRREESEVNQLYVESLTKLGKLDSAKMEAEIFFKTNKSNPIIDAFLKEINNNEKPDVTLNTKKNSKRKASLIKENLEFFDFLDEKGTHFTKEDLSNKIVVLDFWATWCNSCIKGFEGMYNLTKQYKNDKDVLFLFLNTSEFGENTQKKAKELIKSKKYDFKILFDDDNFSASKLGVSALPTKLVIDKKGQIRYKQIGEVAGNKEILESVIEQIKKE